MKFLLKIAVPVTLTILASSMSASAQCPVGTVTVHGRIVNLPTDSRDLTIVVDLETSKGKSSGKATATGGEFAVDARFKTQSFPYFPLWGYRCNNLPKSVRVKVVSGSQVFFQKTIKVKDNFETKDGLEYRLKDSLVIDTSRQATNTASGLH